MGGSADGRPSEAGSEAGRSDGAAGAASAAAAAVGPAPAKRPKQQQAEPPAPIPRKQGGNLIEKMLSGQFSGQASTYTRFRIFRPLWDQAKTEGI